MNKMLKYALVGTTVIAGGVLYAKTCVVHVIAPKSMKNADPVDQAHFVYDALHNTDHAWYETVVVSVEK